MSDSAKFLITTAVEEYWETGDRVVFLGEWCRRFSRRAIWEPLRGEIVREVWSDPVKVAAATEYVDAFYERLLNALSHHLNALHETQHSDRYWRIVIGPWLQGYVNVLYDRVKVIATACKEYPCLRSAGPDEKSFIIPADTRHFVELIQDDGYNLQLYTRILQYFEVPVTKRPSVIGCDKAKPPATGGIAEFIRLVAKTVARWPARIAQRYAQVAIDTAYFPAATQAKLAAVSRGRIIHLLMKEETEASVPSKFDRSRIRVDLQPNDTFQKLCIESLGLDIPRCFIEDFAEVGEAARRSYLATPKVIVSANSWYLKESFKQWAATRADEGALLAGVQHGGNYGSIEKMPSEDHETTITDVYYSWGWRRAGRVAEIRPMPAPKLAGRRPLTGSNRSGILYVMTSSPRYSIQFPFVAASFSRYLEWQSRFLQACPLSVRKELRIRMHYEDFGWDVKERIDATVPGLSYSDWSIPFMQDVAQSQLFVCDHLSTTFVEALVANVPTLLFWDTETNPLRAEAVAYYDRLRSAGILHGSPEAAAAAIPDLKEVSKWWHSAQVQGVRASFVTNFGLTAVTEVCMWKEELLSQAKKCSQTATAMSQ